MGLFIGDSEPSKIFVGDTPISKVFLGDTQVRPSGWQPGANTIAYYPLTSTTQRTDQSGNSRTLTGVGTYSFGTYRGVDCCYINGGELSSSISSINDFDGYTCSIWYYEAAQPQSDNGSLINFGYQSLSAPAGILRAKGRPDPLYGVVGYRSGNGPVYHSTAYNTNLGSWNNYCYVSTNGTGYFYVNGTLYNSFTIRNLSRTLIGISRFSDMNRSIRGYVSEAIFESKARTAQEITDYYNQTKGDYGIS